MSDNSEPIVMPHSRAAEEAFLGALLIDPEMVRRTSVQPEDFYITRNAYVFQAIQDLTRTGQYPDYVTVCTYLDSQKRLMEIGGPAYVTSLINATPTSLNAQGYAEIIQQRAKRRAIIYATQALTAAAFDGDSDLSNAVGSALDTLSRSVVTNKGATHIQRFVSEVYDEVDVAQRNPQDVYGISTGLDDIDRITYGLQRGEKWLLSGEPGVGKSLFAVQMLIYAAKNGIPGALYELEMSGNQVVRRSLASETKRIDREGHITTHRMRQGKLTDEEIPILTNAVEIMSSLPIYISDTSDLTTAELRADLMRLKENHGVQIAVIDYEGLLGDAPEQRDENVRSKLISKRVHDIAKDLNLAVIAISDMTKEGIKGQVKGQGAVAGTARGLHDADQIIIIRKGDGQNTVRLTWEKMREGDSDRFVDLVRVPGFPMFEGIARLP